MLIWSIAIALACACIRCTIGDILHRRRNRQHHNRKGHGSSHGATMQQQAPQSREDAARIAST